MSLPQLSVNRPVTTVMLTLIVIILGGLGFMNLQQEMMPELDLGIAVVIASYDGAGPEEVENLVTVPLRNALGTVSNLQNISTTSTSGMSIVMLEFAPGTDMNHAALAMRENIDMWSALLPAGVDPMVLQLDPNMMESITIGITGPFNMVTLLSMVENQIVPSLERLDGVASVGVSGGIAREISIEIDPGLLAHYGLSTAQIAGTLRAENINRPGGLLAQGTSELQVRTVGQFSDVNEIANLPLMTPTGATIRLSDVATIVDGFSPQTSYALINGQQGIVIDVSRQSTANIVDVSNLVQGALAQLRLEFPELDFMMIEDSAEFIVATLANVWVTVIQATALAMLVLLVFLGNARAPMIIGVSIPVSLISTLAVMYFMDMSLNMITLNAMVISVGMLVDNSIVVLENIMRYLDLGYTPKDAAKKGAGEIGLSVMASTATTVVIFVPILFTQGLAGEMFGQLGLVIAFALLSSLVVAMTFVPMASSKFLIKNKATGSKPNLFKRFSNRFEAGFTKLENWYEKFLPKALKKKKTVLLSFLVFVLLTGSVIGMMGMEFMAEMDSGAISINIEVAQGSLLEEVSAVTGTVLERIDHMHEIDSVSAVVGGGGGMAALFGGGGGHTASVSIQLVPTNQRRDMHEIIADIRTLTDDIPGADIRVQALDPMAAGAMGVQLQLFGEYLPTLMQTGDNLIELIGELPFVTLVTSSAEASNAGARVEINRQQAAFYGLTASQVADVVNLAISGQTITQLRQGADEIDVVLRYDPQGMTHLPDLTNLMITTPMGITIPLAEVASITIEQGPASITTNNNQQLITLSATFEGTDLATASNAIAAVVHDYGLPLGVTYRFGGDFEMMMESFVALALAMLLGFVLLYMVMASQFESLVHPFIIIFSVPIAWTSGLFGVFLTGDNISIVSFIGLILLMGIVVNNGIILIDYINLKLSEGSDILEAIVQGSKVRLRPILMTTVTTVMGAIPMIFASGEGAEMQSGLGAIIAFGLSFSTLITLVLIPVLYHMLDTAKVKRQAKRASKAQKHVIAEPTAGN